MNKLTAASLDYGSVDFFFHIKGTSNELTKQSIIQLHFYIFLKVSLIKCKIYYTFIAYIC